jgi:hypothetical protein
MTLRISVSVMAIHNTICDLYENIIEEYILAAEQCLAFRKKNDNGALGYPSVLLMFCIVEGIAYCRNSETKEPFHIVLEEPFSLRLDKPQIKKIEKWFRNPLAHNAIMAPGALLTGDEFGDVFEFSDTGQVIKLRVVLLLELIKDAWEKFDRESCRELDRVLRRNHLELEVPELPIATSSASTPASGYFTETKRAT